MIRGKKKIGILGGTFNPIHLGHLILAENAYWQFGLEKILIMPSNCPPHKTTASLVSNKNRLDMTKLAIMDNPHFELSTVEYEREGVTYTSDTLEHLTDSYPDVEFYFIIGGDSLQTIHKWHDPKKIFRLANIIATTRDEMDQMRLKEHIDYLSKEYSARIYPMQCPRIDLSSKWIRECISNGAPVTYYIPKKVEQYIKENKLYLSINQ